MLKVHILNVGHGDCIIVEFPSGNLTMVDINRASYMDIESLAEVMYELNAAAVTNVEAALLKEGMITLDSVLEKRGYDIKLTDPLKYMADVFPRLTLFRFISTHPHMDHITGLRALKDKLGFLNAWVLKTGFDADLSEATESQEQDWGLYKNLREDNVQYVTVVRPLEGSQNNFWQQDGIHILSPNSKLLSEAVKHNDTSYVLLIQYGLTKVILGGDAEQKTWNYIYDTWKKTDVLKGVTLLKASHHGRDTGYYEDAVKMMRPKATVLSVGKKPENDAHQKYKKYSTDVFSTRWRGTMKFYLDDQGGGSYDAEYDR